MVVINNKRSMGLNGHLSIRDSTLIFHQKGSYMHLHITRPIIETRCVCETKMAPIMTNSNDGRDHKDKYYDTSTKINSQKMIMCDMDTTSNICYFKLWSMSINFLKIGKKVRSKGLCPSSKTLSKRIFKGNSSSTHFSIVINKVKVSQKKAKVKVIG